MGDRCRKAYVTRSYFVAVDVVGVAVDADADARPRVVLIRPPGQPVTPPIVDADSDHRGQRSPPTPTPRRSNAVVDDKCQFAFSSHDWSADEWDWPLQTDERGVRVQNTVEKFKVMLDVRYFGPNEIQVSAYGQELWIHCKQQIRADIATDARLREFHRSYRLPDDVDTATLKFLLRKNGGLLLIEADKRPTI